MVKKNTMNLFELYDYIEALEKRIEKIEQIFIKETREKFDSKPPFYYHKKPKEDRQYIRELIVVEEARLEKIRNNPRRI